jgi:hypothetical protein
LPPLRHESDRPNCPGAARHVVVPALSAVNNNK